MLWQWWPLLLCNDNAKKLRGDNYDMFLVKKKDEKAMQNVTSFALLSLEKGKKSSTFFQKVVKAVKASLMDTKKATIGDELVGWTRTEEGLTSTQLQMPELLAFDDEDASKWWQKINEAMEVVFCDYNNLVLGCECVCLRRL